MTELVARDFVYCGVRIASNGKRVVAIKLVKEDGTLEESALYEYNRKMVQAVGYICTGAKFDGQGRASGLEKARMVKQWPDTEAVLNWTAQTRASETDYEAAKIQKDLKQKDEIEALMLPLRKLYDKHRRNFNGSGCESLRLAVLAALQTPVRKSEEG